MVRGSDAYDSYEASQDGSMVGDWIAGRACAGAGTSHSVLPAFGSRQARELDSDSAGPGSSLGKAAWVEIIREFCDAGGLG